MRWKYVAYVGKQFDVPSAMDGANVIVASGKLTFQLSCKSDKSEVFKAKLYSS